MNFRDLPLMPLQDFVADASLVRKFAEAISAFGAFETARLRVRPLVSGDEALIHQVLGPPEIHKWNYLFRNGFSLADAKAYVAERLAAKKEGTGLGLIFEDRHSGALLGEIHGDFDPDLLAGDIGYATLHTGKAQGKGFATEAAQGFLAALCAIGLRNIVLTAAPDNVRSHKVIAKLNIPQIPDIVLEVRDADNGVHLRNLYYVDAKDWRRPSV